jgi:pimeloyl-ACP methyl ester carboxylesterase
MSFGRAESPNGMNVNGVDVCVETFGDPADPPILLIMGSGASMDFWEGEFCRRLRDGGRFVIRYDHRDTGQSIAYAPGKPEYTGDDLVADAAGVIEAVGLTSAHVVGMSMGGALAQLVALDHPARVRTLTLISTTGIAGDDELPGIDDRLKAAFARSRSRTSRTGPRCSTTSPTSAPRTRARRARSTAPAPARCGSARSAAPATSNRCSATTICSRAASRHSTGSTR